MALNSLKVEGVTQAGAIASFNIPRGGSQVNVLAYSKGPGAVSGGLKGTEIGSFQLQKPGGTRWYDVTQANIIVCAVASDTQSKKVSVSLDPSFDYRFTVTDDRAEPVDVELELVVK